MSTSRWLRIEGLRQDLREHAFSGRGRTERIGAEVELIPVHADSGAAVPITDIGSGGTLGFLQSHGGPQGWHRTSSTYGLPLFELPGGGAITFEPGGQIEYASPAAVSVDAVVLDLLRVIEPVVAAGREAGIAFVARGFDPVNPAASGRLQLSAPRYDRMCAHYDRRGLWGRRMMCQSAAFHINLDWGDATTDRWRVANAAVPVWTAMFANSPKVVGEPPDHRSVRAFHWRHLDPGRCGTVGGTGEPASEYLDFALGADAFLMGPEDARAEPMRTWVEAGCVDLEAWYLHLSTLFPEVRPRGYMELRAFDALKPRWYAAPLVQAVGLLYDPEALRTALGILPPPTPEVLERAGRLGMADPELASRASEIAALALEGAVRLGERVGATSLETARAFAEEFTYRGRDPGEESGDYA